MYKGGIFGIVALVAMIVAIADSVEKSFQYRYADFEAIMSPDLTSKEVVDRTGCYMKGNVGKSFLLDLSFVGYYLLLVLVYAVIIYAYSEILWGLGYTAILIFSIVYLLVVYFIISFIGVTISMAHLIFYEDKRILDEISESYEYEMKEEETNDNSPIL